MTTLPGMEGGWLARVRWRHRGAWLWPTFAAATLADALIGHALPPSGDSESLVSAALLALLLNLLAVLLLCRPLGMAVRRVRRDLPRVVAADYAGRGAIVSIALVLLIAGLVHRPAIVAQRRAMRDAITRAQAFIGDRAPAEFRRNLRWVDTFAIEPGRMYRTCVPGAADARTYCVIVNVNLPFAESVTFAGYEPNAVFSEGVG